MRDVTIIVSYQKKEFLYLLHSISLVNCKGMNISLLQDFDGLVFETLNSAYEYVLRLAKRNSFTCYSYYEFGREWYDIYWFNINNPIELKHYGYTLDDE